MKNQGPIIDVNKRSAKNDVQKSKDETMAVQKRNQSLEKTEKTLREKLKQRREANDEVENKQSTLSSTLDELNMQLENNIQDMKIEKENTSTLLSQKKTNLQTIRNLKRDYIRMTRDSDQMMQNLQTFINQGIRINKQD